jgi:hypothetical protein
MSNHPIIPPPNLTDKWNNLPLSTEEIFVIAAQWGADQELEACLLWVGDGRRENLSQVIALRNSRRPEPPSLKEQALEALEALERMQDQYPHLKNKETIRQALEAL